MDGASRQLFSFEPKRSEWERERERERERESERERERDVLITTLPRKLSHVG